MDFRAVPGGICQLFSPGCCQSVIHDLQIYPLLFLLLYIEDINQHHYGIHFTGTGFLIIFRRLSKRTGIHVTPHALRRTFVILSLRAGMDVLHLQAMLGQSSLGIMQHYAQMIDEDLLQSHKAHSPIDNLARL
jgi:integrase